MLPFPKKKYSIIYADPPWAYKDKALAGNRGSACKYETPSQADLEALPVQEIADQDCALFLWVTMPKLQDGLDLIRAWGFAYKTCAFTWVKRNKVQNTAFTGMGNWTRSNAELCLLATKGRPKRISASISQLVIEPLTRHSAKPPVVRDKIVELMGGLPRIELFARDAAKGWDAWGNEAPEDLDNW